MDVGNWIATRGCAAKAAARRFAREFHRSSRGNVAMIFAIALPVLVLIIVGGVDISRATTVRSNLQDALDAATLAAARSSATSPAALTDFGTRALRANLQNYPDINLTSATFRLNGAGVVIGDATVSVKTLVANIVLPPYGKILDDDLPVGSHSEVNRSSQDIEVALVLDITGSMLGSRLSDLKTAAYDLVTTVVQEGQSPQGVPGLPRTRMALVPYSMGVNPGAYLTAARGAIRRATDINGIVNTCKNDKCTLVVTSPGHGLATGERVRIDGVRGMTQVNIDIRNTIEVRSGVWTITRLTADTFSINKPPSSLSTYASSSSDKVQCVEVGCQYYVFDNYSGDATILPVGDCVSERTGPDAYKETAPGTVRVGLTYPATDNRCLPSIITPLTTDRTLLHDQIATYAAVGSTAGQIGVGWGWYMVSPIFGKIFPIDNQPADYDIEKVVKIVIIMTDGEFNTPYCNSVVTGDVTGSGGLDQHIRCDTAKDAYNGNPFQQAVDMCNAMKANERGIEVYTVGFDISGSRGKTGVDTAKEVMEQCATDADHVFLPQTGASLKEDFATIGRKISQLRISK